MSDQLSKVVAEMRDRANGWRHGAHPAVTAELSLEWADRIESAAAPVEVDAVAWFIDDGTTKSFTTREIDADLWGKEPGYTITPLVPAEAVATLARQLAEAKAGRLTLTQDYCDMRDRAEQAESALSAATRRVAEVEGIAENALERLAGFGLADDLRDDLEALQKEPK